MVQNSRSPRAREARQRQILVAAARVFRRQGVQSTGMRDIAAELDMAVGNLYYYFRDKQELLAFCQRDALAQLLELADEVLAAPTSARDQLARLIRGHLHCLHTQTPGSIAHLEIEALEEPERSAVVELRNRYEAAVTSLLRRGIEEGSFRELSPELGARALLGALNWTARWYDPEGPLDPNELGDGFVDLLLGGFLPPTRPLEGDAPTRSEEASP